MDISIIIPCHNESERLPQAIGWLNIVRTAYPEKSIECLIVENGSTDHTAAIALDLVAANPGWLRCILLDTTGYAPGATKGAALAAGMLAAQGDIRIMADADIGVAMPTAYLIVLANACKNSMLAIASREGPVAKRYDEPPLRHLAGRIFNALVRSLAGLPAIQDTQCGFKAFAAPAAIELFSRLTIGGFAADVEILHIAHHRGYKIIELPIPWTHDPHTTVNMRRDAPRMLADLFRIRYNSLTGVYDRPLPKRITVQI